LPGRGGRHRRLAGVVTGGCCMVPGHGCTRTRSGGFAVRSGRECGCWLLSGCARWAKRPKRVSFRRRVPSRRVATHLARPLARAARPVARHTAEDIVAADGAGALVSGDTSRGHQPVRPTDTNDRTCRA
jgi:hypothetical protein